MDEDQAKAIAEALGGQPWQSGGDTWLVLSRRSDGKIVALSEESACLYESEEQLLCGAQPEESLVLR